MNNENTINDAVTICPGGECLGRIDQYELVRELGGGGFGTVYLARDTVAGIEVAVKGLPPIIRNNAEELERIRANFAFVSRLHHPYIAAALVLHPAREVSYIDPSVRQKLRVDPGDTLMVMEYAPGVTLSQWRRQFPAGKVPLEPALQLVWQIAQALDYAHGQHIIHRDIKPSNIMVETMPDGEVTARLLDFGLAAEIRSSMGRVSREIHDTSGTRPYMAPEQWSGRKQGPATDQYALAVLLCELLTGEVPFASVFETGDPVVMMTAVCNREVELPESCPRQAALRRALAKEPSQRFASCMEFIETAAKSGSIQIANTGVVPTVRGEGTIKDPGLIASPQGGAFRSASKGSAQVRKMGGKKILLPSGVFLAVLLVALVGWCASKYRMRKSTGQFLAACETRRYDEAARLINQIDKSDVHVQYELGWMYLAGNGVVSNATEAGRWFKRAADQKYAKAQLTLGIMLAKKDYAAAIRWLRAAAEQGDPNIQLTLGSLLKEGIIAKQDDAEAVIWYRKAAEQGLAGAQYLLGESYFNGSGVAKDEAVAVRWYRKAAENGNVDAQFALGQCYFTGEGVAKDEIEAVKWFRNAAWQGHARSQFALGAMYEYGWGVEMDKVDAMRWYRKAADQGNDAAKEKLEKLNKR